VPLWKDSNTFTEEQRQQDVKRAQELNEMARKLSAKYNGPLRGPGDVSTMLFAILDPIGIVATSVLSFGPSWQHTN